MKNLKRVLSLMLTVAMMIGCFAMSTSAAFTDQNEIENTEAVNMATALGIIQGFPDGSYHPEDLVTRAQMSKMISIIMNKGADPVLDSTIPQQYTDVPLAHWAFRNIAYCTGFGIVEGLGDGNFAPESGVTGTEAAKMLLVTLGYNADIEKFNGPTWKLNVNIRAGEKKLYDELSIDPNAALTRDSAAQMIWNALQANEVEYKYTGSGELVNAIAVDRLVGTPGTKITLLEDKFGTQTIEVGIMMKSSYSDKKGEFTYEFMSNSTTGAKVTAVSKENFSGFYGMNVKIVGTPVYATGTTTVESMKDVYGMFAADSVIIASGSLIDFDQAYTEAGKVKFAGETYDIESSTWTTDLQFFAKNQWGYDTSSTAAKYFGTPVAFAAAIGALDVNSFYEAYLIDLDDNDKIDLVTFMPFGVGEVTAVNTKNISIKKIAGTVASANFEDDTIYDGVAVGDYVKFIDPLNTPFTGKEVSLIEPITGTVGSIDTTNKEVDIDGVDYHYYDTSISMTPNKEYDVYAVGSMIFAAELAGEADLSELVYLEAVECGTFSARAKVMFIDGTSEIITVAEAYKNGTTEIKVDSTTKELEAHEGQLFTFVEKSGSYTLTKVDLDNKLGFAKALVDTTGSSLTKIGSDVSFVLGGLATVGFADDAVVFIKYMKGTTETIQVITGAQAKKLTAISGLVGTVLYDSAGAVHTAGVALIDASGAGPMNVTGDESYAYVMSTARDAGSGNYKVALWTEGATAKLDYTVTGFGPGITHGDMEAGLIVKYSTVDGSGNEITIDEMYEVGTDMGEVALRSGDQNGVLWYRDVVASNETSNDEADDVNIELEDDYSVLTIKTSNNNDGSNSTALIQANETDANDGTLRTNAAILIEGGKVVLIVVDIDNAWN